MVAVSLVNRMGYFRQELTATGGQIAQPDPWDPATLARSLSEIVKVQMGPREVQVKAWMYDYQAATGSLTPVVFLDTDVDGNTDEERQLTSFLYGGDHIYRLKQAMVPGIGRVRMLDTLDIPVLKYHMNEGQSSLLALELLRRSGEDTERTRDRCVFTTHTPVSAAFYSFPYDTVHALLGDEFDLSRVREITGQDEFKMIALALGLSTYVNGVAEEHMESSRRLFSCYRILAITNGVHPFTWTSQSSRDLFDRHFHGWAHEPELLVRIDTVSGEEIHRAHMKAKAALLRRVLMSSGVRLDLNTLTIGFARRMTAYKRAALLFTGLDRLKNALRFGPFQVVMAGKARPLDGGGKELIRAIFAAKEELKGIVNVVFLDNYDIDLAGPLTAGSDLWLNTPMPPLEASGTSGMKAAFNGVVNFSILDGWWAGGGGVEDDTGWAIGPIPEAEVTVEERQALELDDLYSKLEYIIVPKFYNEKEGWTEMMENSIGKIAYYFNTHRMMRRYVSEACLQGGAALLATLAANVVPPRPHGGVRIWEGMASDRGAR